MVKRKIQSSWAETAYAAEWAENQATIPAVPEPANDLGTLLRTLRAERGLSQQTLADLAGVSSATIYRMESGKPAHSSTAERIAKTLDQSRPLTFDQADEYARLAGVPRLRLIRTLQTDVMDPPPRDLIDPPSPRIRGNLWDTLGELVEAYGEDAMHGALMALRVMMKNAAPEQRREDAPGDSHGGLRWKVHGEPIQHEGYVEEVRREVEILPEGQRDQALDSEIDRVERLLEELKRRRG